MLDLHAAGVADAVMIAVGTVLVVFPPADHLHGVVAGEEAIALFLFDHQALQRVMVIHGVGHVEPDAAHGIHDLAHGLPLQHHLIVRGKAHQLADLLVEGLDALVPAAVGVIDGVDLLDVPGDIDHGVPGNGHDGGRLIGHIVAGQEHGVRVSTAAGIPSQNEHGIIGVAFARAAGSGLDAVAPVDLSCGALLRKLRADEPVLVHGRHRHGHRQQYRHCQQKFLQPGQPGAAAGSSSSPFRFLHEDSPSSPVTGGGRHSIGPGARCGPPSGNGCCTRSCGWRRRWRSPGVRPYRPSPEWPGRRRSPPGRPGASR